MHLEAVLRYPASPAAVAALLADRSFVEDLCRSGAATAWRVDVSGSAGAAFTVATERTVPTAQLPDAARRLLGEHLVIEQVDSWQAPDAAGRRTGSTRLAVRGAPVTAAAALALAPDGAGSREEVRGEVRASVPLLGGRVERAAEPVLLAALREQEQLAARRLRA
ncbi:DUF2505 domain-containing protein [Quadrisphaera sp. DSM 44207]|uniref:DUF2505 domain-containing protein n=1 Tax=Quadrisphaera sp. DSM 44207 TaxID=1881057 RepID=UPI0008809EF8|nr:DUF2505 domain-containing protein [Quadrisphaera sp. DSM 44207]SDQ08686.1 Protein of unknown function [Quadrisphaera sp. DSM 44207]